MSIQPAKRKPGRPATGKGLPITVRCQPDLVAAIDRRVARLTKRPTSRGVISRATVIRAAVEKVLLAKGAK